MAKRYTDALRRDAVPMVTTSGLTRPYLSSDLGVAILFQRVSTAPEKVRLQGINEWQR